jgi:hypothetical protein
MDKINNLIDRLADLQGQGPGQVAAAEGIATDMVTLKSTLSEIETSIDELLALCTRHSERGGQIGQILAKLESATNAQTVDLVAKLKDQIVKSQSESGFVGDLAKQIKDKINNALPGLRSPQQGGKRKTRRQARKHHGAKRGGWRVRTARRGRPGTKRRGASFRGARRTHRHG